MSYYTMHETPEAVKRRSIMPKIRHFVESADIMGGGVNQDRPDGIVTGHELYRALKDMFRKIVVVLPFTPKDLIKEANIHSGPLASSDKERFVDIFSERIIKLVKLKPEFSNIDEIMFSNASTS